MPPAYTAFSFCCCPHPPAPFPTGRGRSRLFYARGFAPCIPRAEPGRHWNREANHAPGGGLVSGVGGSTCRCGTRRGRVFSLPLPPAAFSFDSAPIPHPPSPAGKGEIKVIFMQGASPLASPALDRLRRLQSQRNRHSGGRRIPETALTVSAHPVEFFPGSRHEPRLLRSYIREKFWGGWGTLSRVPRRCSLAVAPPIHTFKKSSGGSGGLFQESPGASP